MRILQSVLGTLVLLGTSLVSAAQALDSSKPLLCAATEAAECRVRERCVQGPADVVNLPLFFKIDFGENLVDTTREGGQRRTSRILSTAKEGGAIILQGAEQGAAWSMTIAESNGKMTLTVSKEGAAYVAFGACTVL